MLRNIGKKNIQSYKRYYCSILNNNKNLSPSSQQQPQQQPPTNNYRHNYFSDVQNYKPYEDDNILVKSNNNEINNNYKKNHYHQDQQLISVQSNLGFIGSLKNQMEKLTKITKNGLVTLWKDRSFYKDILLPKSSALNESFTKRILPTFPIHNQDSFRYLTFHERKSIVSYRIDRLSMIPLSIFLSIPFSTLALPFYIKFLPGLLPRGFSERSQVLSRHHKITSLRRRIVEKVIEGYGLTNEINELAFKSISDITPLKLKPLQYKLDFNLEDMKRSKLKKYCRILGHTTWFNSKSSLIEKFLNSGSYTIQENEAIAKEINELTFEDLQDLLYSRSLEYDGLNYYDMKTKFLNYVSLLKSISVIEDGEKDLALNPNTNLSNRHQSHFYKQYLILKIVLIHYQV
ncbi:hypothetical protein RB653_002968 [Dictyostelium firmibasis]|uniref:Letm1 RBD domain-containing protein n=1 Tax=Dictyostelium firmibasis TaxID=79012 RepID=A0AAN7TYR6_9MYCE